MRYARLRLQTHGDEVELRFHDRLTVVAGIGVLERTALVDSLLGGLAGTAPGTELELVDGEGRPLVVTQGPDGGAWATRDGDPVTPLTARGLDPDRVGSVGVLHPPGSGPRQGEPPELAEARAALSALTEELQAALSAQEGAAALSAELADLDERLRSADENRARRAYARVLAELERVRSELATVGDDDGAAARDQTLVAAAERVQPLAQRWSAALDAVGRALEAFGDRERLDARTLEHALELPDQLPDGIEQLAAELDGARTRRDDVEARLDALAEEHLPAPSDPVVARLARRDQDTLWDANARALEAAREFARASIALGGLGGAADDTPACRSVEQAQTDLLQAEQRLARLHRRGVVGTASAGLVAAVGLLTLPLLTPAALAGAAATAFATLLWPRRRIRHATRKVEDALHLVEAPSYLSFHLRRIDALFDQSMQGRLELAALAHRMAVADWHETAGETLDAGEACWLEDEVRSYAAQLQDLSAVTAEIEELRAKLHDELEPAVTEAEDALLRACEPFGVDDSELGPEMVRREVELARTGKLQRELEHAEEAERTAREHLEAALAEVGFLEGDLDDRLGALRWSAEQAEERVRARGSARPRAQVEAEFERLEAEARRLRRPEFANVTPAEADEPDTEELRRRRESVAASYAAAAALVPDVERLRDRHRAVERRVAVLAAEGADGDRGAVPDADELRDWLLSRLTAARTAGPDGDAVPVVLDDVLNRVGDDDKWELLGLVERVSEKVQLIYLTDDAYVGAWARRRSAAGGELLLLEPDPEPDPRLP